MGASSDRWTGLSGWARDFVFAAVLGVVLGLIGPFGTFVQAGPALRLAYWIGLALAVTPIYGVAFRGAVVLERRFNLPGTIWMAVLAIAAAGPVALISSLAATSIWPFLRAMTPLGWLAQALAVSVFIATPYGVLSRRLSPLGPARAPIPTASAEPATLKGRRDLICLRMEDHYVRIYTAAGSELVYLSMREATDILDPAVGLRVHRSWWVARGAVVAVLNDGRNLRLRLANGLEAPVSRSQVGALRAAGWLESEGR